MPEENLAARNIVRNGSGVVVGPGDSQRFASEAKRLADDPELRESMGLAARSYAETTFDIENIGRRFDAILRAAAGHETLVESSSSR
jgi:glycosyltransferase involved in cell wall biosynthesis